MLTLMLVLICLGLVGVVAGIGNTYSAANLNQDLGSGTPATWYAALLTTLPTDGTGASLVEASYTGYARQGVTNNGTNFPAASVVGGFAVVTCAATLTFPVVAGLGGPITVFGIALFSLSSGGNMGRTAVFGTISAPVSYVLNNGAQLIVSGGNLTFTEQ